MSKIKTASLFKYDYILKDINSEEFELEGGIYNKTTYDEEGRTLSEIKFDPEGVVEQHYEYEYNEQGVKISDKSFDEKGDLIDNLEYSADPKGRVLFGYKKYLDGSKDTITYRYNEDGKLIEKEFKSEEDDIDYIEKFTFEGDHEILHEAWNEDDELAYRKESKYDDKGNVIEEKTWVLETDRTARVMNTYDKDDQLISVASFDENDNIIFKVEYTRNSEGHITEVSEESPEGMAFTSIQYDNAGNAVVQEEKNEKGELSSRIERKFDGEGNVTESEAILDRHGQGMNQHYILKYEYEFY